MGIGNSVVVLVGSVKVSSLPLMGIGNAAVSSRTAKPAWSSLPLMGIGNFRLLLQLTDEPLLITPHGDRKRCGCVPRTARSRTPHYPSWGSETLVSSSVAPWTSVLITPHGDRKLFAPPAEGRIVAVVCSLPLMGIENLARTLRVSKAEISLPPMGIGNVRGRRRPFRGGRLITPHGDRKQGSRIREACDMVRRGSLPLMGIGNFCSASSAASRCALAIGLITPHGDRKHHRPHGAVSEGCLRGCLLLDERLITPHGDRKHQSSSPRTPPRRTSHYPSWGSETSTTISPWKHSSRPAHYPSWGSETAPGLALPRSRSWLLITPHGDRKPPTRG